MNRRRFFGATGALALIMTTGIRPRATRAQITYSSIDLGMPPGYDSVAPVALNDNGAVVVVATANDKQAVFLLTDGAFTQLGNKDTVAHATCIDIDANVGGWIENTSASASERKEIPVILTPDSQAEMPGSPVDGRVYALQQGGNAVGAAVIDPGNPNHKAVIWANHTISELKGTPKDATSAARDINAQGQIVGWIEKADGSSTIRSAVLLDSETDPVAISGLEGAQGEAVAISEQGQIVGITITSDKPADLGGDGTTPFLWSNGTLKKLQPLADQTWGVANDVNSFELVAGTVGLSTPNAAGAITTAVVWGNELTFDLNITAQPVEGVLLTAAVSIDEMGQVLCSGIDADGKSHAILLSLLGN